MLALRSLIAAAKDQNVSVGDFLRLAACAINSTSGKSRAEAAELVIQQVFNNSDTVAHVFRSELEKIRVETDTREYLLHLIELGELFLLEGEARNRELGRLVIQLIGRNASDPLLSLPYCVDTKGQVWSQVAAVWEQAIVTSPSDVNVLSNAAEFYLIQEPQRARELFEICARLNPENQEWKERVDEAIEFADDP